MFPSAAALFLIFVSQFSFLAFHTLAELFAVVISLVLFSFAWSTRTLVTNNFLLFLACGYFWIGLLDLIHTFVYKGMNAFVVDSGNMSIQFWVGTRFLEALVLLVAPFVIAKKINEWALIGIWGGVACVLTALILSGLFPIGFIEGEGLTDFKVYSEYMIIVMLVFAIITITLNGSDITKEDRVLIIAAIIMTICAELAFTFYISVYGISNLVGHIIKIFSFWFIFQAVVISNLKRPYIALKKSMERSRNLFENNEVSIWNENLTEVYEALERLRHEGVSDLRGYLEENKQVAWDFTHLVRVSHVNKAALILFDTKNQAELIRGVGKTFGPGAIEVFINGLCAIWDKQKTFRSEIFYKTIEGKIFPAIISFIIPETKNGFQSVPVSIIDTTELKHAEDVANKLSSAVEQSSSMVIITDTKGEIEYVNKKFVNTTGYSVNEVIGQNPRIFKTGHTSLEEYRELWKTISTGGEWSGELRNKRKDGTFHWEYTSISPIRAKDGRITNYLSVSEDVTEKKELGNQLRRAQKMDVIGQLTGGISHDFNNLLGIIIGNIDLINLEIVHEGKLQGQLMSAKKAALRGAELTRRLLRFSSQESSVQTLTNINKHIRSVEILIRKSLTSMICTEITLADDLWMVTINGSDFEDVMINLSLNAKDAMPGGGRLIIDTKNIVLDQLFINGKEGLDPGDYVEIAIRDTGVGIPKKITDKIFEPFFTTKEVDKGTGLGLSMVYGFIQRSKGHISVHSEEGIGTKFIIYLPRSNSNAEQIEPRTKNDHSVN